MSVTEASDCALAVVSLYDEILRAGDSGPARLPSLDGDQEPVPPFLLKTV